LNDIIHFACPIFSFVITIYDLVIGFLVPGERGSSGRGVGSSIGEGGYV